MSYLACARKLLAAPDAVFPQFATHNAQTLATDHRHRRARLLSVGQYEFQCLHGMGEPLYEEVVGRGQARPAVPHLRAGRARTRRCSPISSGACWRTAPTPPSSTASPTRPCSIDDLVADPVEVVARHASRSARRTTRSPLPRDLYGAIAPNSRRARSLRRERRWPRSPAALERKRRRWPGRAVPPGLRPAIATANPPGAQPRRPSRRRRRRSRARRRNRHARARVARCRSAALGRRRACRARRLPRRAADAMRSAHADSAAA